MKRRAVWKQIGLVAFFVSAATKAARWRVDPDGDTLRLNSTEGLTLILR